MIPNLFDLKRNPISAVLGIILFWALGVQLAYPEITSHFPVGIIDMWEGKSWMIWVQSFFSYDWRQFLMIFMSVLLLGVGFERKIGRYSYFSLVIVCFFGIPQLLNLIMEPLALGANAFLGMLLILKMTGRYPKVSAESFRSSIYLFFILALYLLYYGQHNSGVEAQIGHFQFLMGVILAFSWRFWRILTRKIFKNPRVQLRLRTLGAHILVMMTLLMTSTAYFASWDARWQINEMEKLIQAGELKQAQLQFNEISDPNNPLTAWLLVYLQLRNQVRIQSLPEMIEILKNNSQVPSQLLLVEIYMGVFDSQFQRHDVAWNILKTLPEAYPEVLNLKAMLYCGSMKSSHHNSEKGIEIMTELNHSSQWSEPAYLDTYAACLARSENWTEAQKWIIRAEKLQRKQNLDKTVNKNAHELILFNRDLILQQKPIVYGSGLNETNFEKTSPEGIVPEL